MTKQKPSKTTSASSENSNESEKSAGTSSKQSTEATTGGKKGVVLTAAAVAVLAIAAYAALHSTHMTNSTSILANSTALLSYQEAFGNLLERTEGANSTLFRDQWNKLRSSMSSEVASPSTGDVGRRMAETHKALHPVFLVPGFVTSGLELWQGHECAIQYFRRKIWGSLETFRSFAQDTECWKQHLSLDPTTGKDPPGIRLRASQGFDAADYWTSAFWVWDRVIRNLAAVGYDGSNMDMVSYDWRMSYPALEERDGHFSKLKSKIESYVEYTGQKAVIMGHSMGGPKVFFFLVWVGKPKKEGGGGGGPDWVERYIHAYVNLAGPMMGMPKAASALLSGDMKETNLLSSVGGLIESMFGRKKRHELFSSWGALWGMTPKGGDAVWGVTADVDCGSGRVPRGDKCIEEDQAGDPVDIPFLTFTDDNDASYDDPLQTEYAQKPTWSFTDVMNYLTKWKQGDHGPESLKNSGSWNDPTQHGLPNAPSLNVYCLYGVGLPTERMFYYIRKPQQQCNNDTNTTSILFAMNDTVPDDSERSINFGVRTSNGDGSVPLISLGYMCAEGWKASSELNPGNANIVPREYQHEGSFQVNDPLRQGPKSSEHCDLLGNHQVLEDVIKIATGETVERRIVSNIENISAEIHTRLSNPTCPDQEKHPAQEESPAQEEQA